MGNLLIKVKYKQRMSDLCNFLREKDTYASLIMRELCVTI
jgi:hypothetical protein